MNCPRDNMNRERSKQERYSRDHHIKGVGRRGNHLGTKKRNLRFKAKQNKKTKTKTREQTLWQTLLVS